MIRIFIYIFCLERDRKNIRERERKSVIEKENERKKERDLFLKIVMILLIMKF